MRLTFAAAALASLLCLMGCPSSLPDNFDAQESALQTLSLAYGQDDFAVPDDLDARAQLACRGGYEALCDWPGGDLSSAVDHFEAPCADNDPVACVVIGWTQTQIRPGMPTAKAASPRAGALAFKRACDAELGRGCWEYARLYAKGIGVPESPSLAYNTFDAGCKADHLRSCASAGLMAAQGRGTEADTAYALDLSMRACDGGVAAGCLGLATLHGQGLGVPVNAEKSRDFLDKACKMGLLSACADQASRLMESDPERAESLLADACDQGSANACHRLGSLRDDTTLWQRACDDGLPQACGDLAASLLDADPPDTARGIALRDRACKAGHGESCGRLGWRYQLGAGVSQSPSQAARLHGEGCQLGWLASCQVLGHQLLQGQGIAADPVRGAELLQTACQGGEMNACNTVAALLSRTDSKASAELFRTACDRGNAPSCTGLGVLLSHQGDATEARELFEKSCLAGDVNGCIQLADALSTGADAKPKRAATLLTSACHAGQADACYRLARLFADTDTTETLTLLGTACERDHLPACTTLGDMVLSGTAVTADPVAAARLFTRACDGGFGRACLRMAKLETTPDRVLDWNRRACAAGTATACAALPEAAHK